MTASTDTRGLQVLVFSEEEDRVVFGLNMALTAALSGREVAVFFALGAARWVCAEHEGPCGPTGLVRQLVEVGAELHCCSACVHEHCHAEQGEGALLEGVRRGGLASLVKRVSETHQALTI